MSRFGVIVLCAFAMAAVAGASSSQNFASPARLSGGPSDTEIAAVWPVAAKQAGVEGEARIECRVSEQNVLSNCKVLLETPAGQGFGQAALGLTSKFRAEAAKVGGRPTDGVVRFILRFPPQAPPMGPETVGPYTFPEGVEKPTDDQLFAAWPGVARANHVEGWANISCVVSLYGRLDNCNVAQESQPGLGFGEGAMRVKDMYRFLPGTKDTMSVSMRMTFQVRFECKTRCTPFKLPEDFVGKLVSASWTQTPSASDLAAASPKGLQAGHPPARALLFCRLRADGSANRCRVMSEEPAGQGVGAAALALVPQFKTTVTKDFVDAGVQIPVTFSDEVGRAVLLSRPASQDYVPLMEKATADPKVQDARVTLSCVANAGALANCTAADESPAGIGLGELALGLAPKFSVSQWGENGRPTQGSSIKVPLALQVREPPKPSDPPVVTISDPQWLRRPTARDVERFYPSEALSAEKSGVAILACKVDASGSLHDCVIESEAPAGLGFGAAALKMASLFKMKPPAIDGHPVETATIRVPLTFRVN
jgi:TonB family protein